MWTDSAVLDSNFVFFICCLQMSDPLVLALSYSALYPSHTWGSKKFWILCSHGWHCSHSLKLFLNLRNSTTSLQNYANWGSSLNILQLSWDMSWKIQNVRSTWELLKSIFEWRRSTASTLTISFNYEVGGRCIAGLYFLFPSFTPLASNRKCFPFPVKQELPLHNMLFFLFYDLYLVQVSELWVLSIQKLNIIMDLQISNSKVKNIFSIIHVTGIWIFLV